MSTSHEGRDKQNADSKNPRSARSLAVSYALDDGGPTFKQQTMGSGGGDPNADSMEISMQRKFSRSKNSSSTMPSFKMQTRDNPVVDPSTGQTASSSNQSSRGMSAQASAADIEEGEQGQTTIQESPPPVQDAQVGHPIEAMVVEPGYYCTKRMISLTVLVVCFVLTLIVVAVVLLVVVFQVFDTSANATPRPSVAPTLAFPLAENPAPTPTVNPTQAPTPTPTWAPTQTPTQAPTKNPTSSPTMAPTSPPTFPFISTGDRTIDVPNLINSMTLTGTVLAYPPVTASPEELALQWLVDDDPRQEYTTRTATERTHLRQRYALATLFLQDQASSPWINAANWLKIANVCSWHGIQCEQADGGVGLVTSINLFGNNLGGTIPEDLALLTNVNFINFSASNLTGPIPETLGLMTNLETLSIWGNDLTGTLPNLGTLSSLEEFYAYNNRLSGKLPPYIGLWQNMRIFLIFGNQFSGTIPYGVSEWANIESAQFHDNNFTGTMPPGICRPGLEPPDFILEADCEIDCFCCTFCHLV